MFSLTKGPSFNSNANKQHQQQQFQIVRIGHISCTIEKQIAEGGYARVFVGRKVQSTLGPSENDPIVAIKRINLPLHDPQTTNQLKKEVDVMKTIQSSGNKGLSNKNLIQFLDSQLSPDNRELYIAMEYCQFNLINLMQYMQGSSVSRFNEAQVIKVFSDISEAVAFLHCSGSKPIIHRDIKVENVLISMNGGTIYQNQNPIAVNAYLISNISNLTFKLCDFGSCTTKTVPPLVQLSHQQISQIEEEVERQTTLAYRAPEMLDLYRRFGITYKADIWALGVFLYKLCFFTTPFENDGKMAILNHSYSYPPYASQQYSKMLISLIDLLLTDNPFKRPNVYRVMEYVCANLCNKPVQVTFPNIFEEEEKNDLNLEAERTREQQELQQVTTTNIVSSSIQLSPPVAQRRGRVQKGEKQHKANLSLPESVPFNNSDAFSSQPDAFSFSTEVMNDTLSANAQFSQKGIGSQDIFSTSEPRSNVEGDVKEFQADAFSNLGNNNNSSEHEDNIFSNNIADRPEHQQTSVSTNKNPLESLVAISDDSQTRAYQSKPVDLIHDSVESKLGFLDISNNTQIKIQPPSAAAELFEAFSSPPQTVLQANISSFQPKSPTSSMNINSSLNQLNSGPQIQRHHHQRTQSFERSPNISAQGSFIDQRSPMYTSSQNIFYGNGINSTRSSFSSIGSQASPYQLTAQQLSQQLKAVQNPQNVNSPYMINQQGGYPSRSPRVSGSQNFPSNAQYGSGYVNNNFSPQQYPNK